MTDKYLVIIEVSQKQAYIFASNKLKDNIFNSENIVKVTGPAYFAEKCSIFEEQDIVYSGGGHTVLCFDSEEKAKQFASDISFAVLVDYPDMELFIKLLKYDDEKTPGDNLKNLTRELEKKKSIRRSSFQQGTFGLEKIDTITLKPVMKNSLNSEKIKDEFIPEGYSSVSKFENLGGSKNESNFIAVVHIDGNSMGKRVSDLYEKLDSDNKLTWEEYSQKLKQFSDGIDKDFKDAYREMNDEIKLSLERGELNDLSLKDDAFPVRKIIISGDDVCFVSEGRIGLECARIFIEKLCDNKRKNVVDGKGYTACAGIAIVHQKYPFFRAYELAESLCSNAKRFCAQLDKEGNGAGLSAIDWHISFGELGENIEEIREDYITMDGKKLELRPYIICGDKDFLDKEIYRQYKNFRNVMQLITNDKTMEDKDSDEYFARSKIKALRPILKEGETSVINYITINKIWGFINKKLIDQYGGAMGKVFVDTIDGKTRSLIFDAIELMDTFLIIGEE